MEYILSDDSVELIKEIQKDDKEPFKITNKDELLEFAMGVSIIMMGFQGLKEKNKLSRIDEFYSIKFYQFKEKYLTLLEINSYFYLLFE